MIDYLSIAKILINKNCPEFSNLKILPIKNGGRDNQTFHLGDDYIIRMTKNSKNSNQLEKEFKCLPFLAKNLAIKISEPIHFIKTSDDYEFNSGIYRYLEGKSLNLIDKSNLDLINLAKDVARFIKNFHKIDIIDGMEASSDNYFRGADLIRYNDEMELGFEKLKDKCDISIFKEIWRTALKSKSQNPVWVHGDLAIGNILIKHKKLNGIIDFGQIATGDPACDLTIAWTFFEEESRRIFILNLEIDEDTWSRAKGWALWKNLLWPVENRDQNIKILNNILNEYNSSINFSPFYDFLIEN